jgi:hypothetical protein
MEAEWPPVSETAGNIGGSVAAGPIRTRQSALADGGICLVQEVCSDNVECIIQP